LREGTVTTSEVWKRFRVDTRPTYLQDQLGRLTDHVRGINRDAWRWVLRDIDFHAAPGESWALVGANGAGKSTLLKILTRVMYPTAGRVAITGRVGSLIEIGAGLAPLLTGRENIYLTGTLMGLKRKEIARRFDEIVEFAGLESAVDRQVKHYSSGMQMRLGFGVAAHLEPDVLLVDEALAVGDASFQQRCLERMQHVLSRGTTLVFVSHDLAAVEATCTNAVWLDDGAARSVGPVRDVLAEYRRSVEGIGARHPVDGPLRVSNVEISSPGDGIRTGGPLDVNLLLESDEEYQAWIYLGISEGAATPIFLVNPGHELIVSPGGTQISTTIASLPIPLGRYYLWGAAYRNSMNGQELLGWQRLAYFDVHGPALDAAPGAIVRLSPVFVDSAWSVLTSDKNAAVDTEVDSSTTTKSAQVPAYDLRTRRAKLPSRLRTPAPTSQNAQNTR
jgi:ABC-type polysaccharide/polyol phosphate transport system ATPase subunit